jgi:hypothetical protein
MNKSKAVLLTVSLIIVILSVLSISAQSASAVVPLNEEATFKQLSKWKDWLANNQKQARTSSQKDNYRSKINTYNVDALKTINQRTKDRTQARSNLINSEKSAELKAEYDYALEEGNAAVDFCKKDALDYYNEDLDFINQDYQDQLKMIKQEAKAYINSIKKAHQKKISAKKQQVRKKSKNYSSIKKKRKKNKQLLSKSKKQLTKAKTSLATSKNKLQKDLSSNWNNYQEQINFVKQDFAQQKAELDSFYQESLKECDAELQFYLDDYNQIAAEIEADYALIWKDELATINSIDKAERDRIKTMKDNAHKLVSSMPNK